MRPVDLSPNGQYVLTDGLHAVLWDTKSGKQLHEFNTQSAEFSPDGKYILSYNSEYVRLIDINKYSPIHTFYGSFGGISHNGKYVVTRQSQDYIHLWSLETGDEFRVIPVNSGIGLVDFFPDDMYVLTLEKFSTGIQGFPVTFAVWDIQSGTKSWTFIIQEPPLLYDVVLSPNGKYLVSGSEIGTVRVLDPHTGQNLWQAC